MTKPELRPTPILRGKAARRFYRVINDSDISPEQESFIQECLRLINESH